MFELIFFSLLNGLVYGMLLFMLSSGLTLIFGMMGVLNFAHASFYMLGAYFAFTLGLHIGFWPALVIAPVLVGLLGALVERQGLRRVHGFGHIAELIFTFGVAILIEEVVQLVWGRPAKSYQVPDLLDFPLFRVMAQVLGSIVFVVVVIGGLGSITGAFVASLLIGIVQTFAVAMDVSVGGALTAVGVHVNTGGALHDLWKVTIAQVAPILPYVLLVLMLIVRPTGLFGTRET